MRAVHPIHGPKYGYRGDLAAWEVFPIRDGRERIDLGVEVPAPSPEKALAGFLAGKATGPWLYGADGEPKPGLYEVQPSILDSGFDGYETARSSRRAVKED